MRASTFFAKPGGADSALMVGRKRTSPRGRCGQSAAVQHVLDELNLQDRARTRQQWKDEQRTRPLSQLPPIVQAALPHPDRPSFRGLPPGTTWRGAFAKQSDEQDHLDDVDHTDD